MKWESQHKTKREFMIKILQELDEWDYIIWVTGTGLFLEPEHISL
jgi:hypothetical protein